MVSCQELETGHLEHHEPNEKKGRSHCVRWRCRDGSRLKNWSFMEYWERVKRGQCARWHSREEIGEILVGGMGSLGG